MEKDIDKQPHEGSDELDSLRREITDGKEESEINRHSDELDSLHKEVMQTQDEKHIDTQKQHETAELQKEIRAAAAKLEVVN